MGNPIRIFLDDLTYNTIGDDRQQTNPEFLFDYDIDNWIKDTSDKTLKYFRLDKKRSISFEFTDYESKIIPDELDRKNTPSGKVKHSRDFMDRFSEDILTKTLVS